MKFIRKIIKLIKTILTTALLALSIIFLTNNRQIVELNLSPFPTENIEIRLFLLMIIFFCLGLFLATIIYSNSIIKSAFRNFFQKRQIKKLEKQNLKNHQ